MKSLEERVAYLESKIGTEPKEPKRTYKNLKIHPLWEEVREDLLRDYSNILTLEIIDDILIKEGAEAIRIANLGKVFCTMPDECINLGFKNLIIPGMEDVARVSLRYKRLCNGLSLNFESGTIYPEACGKFGSPIKYSTSIGGSEQNIVRSLHQRALTLGAELCKRNLPFEVITVVNHNKDTLHRYACYIDGSVELERAVAGYKKDSEYVKTNVDVFSSVHGLLEEIISDV